MSISISPRAYQRIAAIALFAVAVIIVSGGAVRLTGSGLGCSDWPNCEPNRLTPRSSSDTHAMVEFLNRSFTGFVSVAVIIAVLGALARKPRKRILIWLAIGLVGGVIAQIVLGGLTVLFELRPGFVAAHFLVSQIIVADGVALWWFAGDRKPIRDSVALLRTVRGVGIAAAVVITTGTVVTGAGPHAGDESTPRWNLRLSDVAQLHSTAVWILSALALTAVFVARTQAGRQLMLGLVAVIVAQGALGYTQYFTGVPALLVLFHIIGATILWSYVIICNLAVKERSQAVIAQHEMAAVSQ